MAKQRLAIDVGGTFVDFVLLDEDSGAVRIEKSPASGRLERRFFEGIDNLAIDIKSLQMIIHGSTMVINTIVQEKGARVGLIATRGFRDVLELGRGSREEIYNLFYAPPVPLVERHLRLEVNERMDAGGRVVAALDEEQARAVIRQLKAAGVAGIAICLLHAYVNPAHEERLRTLAAEEFPQAEVTISSEICREWREYERTSTTVLNAYSKPKMAAYLGALEGELRRRDYGGSLNIMQSSGGITSLAAAKAGPIRTTVSGPAGGVIGVAALGRLLDEPNLVAADVGGTTFDVALISGGQPLERGEHRISRRPVLQPTIDIVSIGAGGGSVAWLDDADALHIGPQSVEADPGPACFGLGGELATVTDAQLVLGYLDPHYYLGRRMSLQRARAEAVIQEQVAAPLGMSLLAAAAGVVHLANMNMAYAIRNITIERGYDLREFSLVCYGGGGGLFAGFLLDELESAAAIIPVNPAAFSAWGLLNADFREDALRTYLMPFAQLSAAGLQAQLAGLEAEVRGRFAGYGLEAAQTQTQFYVAMRYDGQEHTVKVPVLAGDFEDGLLSLRRRFDSLHEQAYALSLPEAAAETVSLQVAVLGITRKPVLRRLAGGSADARKGRREVMLRGDAAPLSAVVYDRARLAAGAVIAGPAIIEEWTATVLVLPGQAATVDEYGSLIIKRGQI